MKRELDKKREERNRELVERMRQGDSLSQFNPQLSFFPPRPVIKKDPREIRRVHGEGGA